MLVTTELRSRAWRSNAASVRLRRSNHTATGRPTRSTPTSRTNRSPRDDVIAEGEFSIGCPFEMARSRRILRHSNPQFGTISDEATVGCKIAKIVDRRQAIFCYKLDDQLVGQNERAAVGFTTNVANDI